MLSVKYQTSEKVGFLFIKEKREHQLQALFVEKRVQKSLTIRENLRRLNPETDFGHLVLIFGIDDFPIDKRTSFKNQINDEVPQENARKRLEYDAVIPVKLLFELTSFSPGVSIGQVDSVVVFEGRKIITHVEERPPEWGQLRKVVAIGVKQ
jgi:hypothetical protein